MERDTDETAIDDGGEDDDGGDGAPSRGGKDASRYSGVCGCGFGDDPTSHSRGDGVGVHPQDRGNPFLGWIPWTLRLSYDRMLRGIPGTGTRNGGMGGKLLGVNLDAIVLFRYHGEPCVACSDLFRCCARVAGAVSSIVVVGVLMGRRREGGKGGRGMPSNSDLFFF